MSETLLNEIRGTKPEAPSALRERVRALCVQEPAREPFLARFRWRQLVLAGRRAGPGALRGDGDRPDTRRREPRRRQGHSSGAGEARPPRDELRLRALPDGGLGGAEGGLLLRAEPSDGGSSPRPRGSSSATRRSSACGSTTSRRSRPRRSALSRSRAPRRQRPPRLQYDAPRGSRHRADHAPHAAARVGAPWPSSPSSARSSGSATGSTTCRQQADTLEAADRGDAAADRATGLAAREHDALRRGTAPSSSRGSRTPASKLKGLRESLAGTRAEARTATIYLSLTTEKIEPGAGRRRPNRQDQGRARVGGDRAPLCTRRRRGPFVLVGFLVWLVLRLRRRHVDTRLLEQN